MTLPAWERRLAFAVAAHDLIVPAIGCSADPGRRLRVRAHGRCGRHRCRSRPACPRRRSTRPRAVTRRVPEHPSRDLSPEWQMRTCSCSRGQVGPSPGVLEPNWQGISPGRQRDQRREPHDDQEVRGQARRELRILPRAVQAQVRRPRAVLQRRVQRRDEPVAPDREGCGAARLRFDSRATRIADDAGSALDRVLLAALEVLRAKQQDFDQLPDGSRSAGPRCARATSVARPSSSASRVASIVQVRWPPRPPRRRRAPSPRRSPLPAPGRTGYAARPASVPRRPLRQRRA